MGSLDFTVQVTNISSSATKDDVLTFFSYCGTVDKIQLQRREGDRSQSATVTFRQPYALKKALLLNGASIGDRRVHILPLNNMKDIQVESSDSDSDDMSSKGHREGGYSAVKGYELVVNKVNGGFSKGTAWLADVFDKASKNVAEFGSKRR